MLIRSNYQRLLDEASEDEPNSRIIPEAFGADKILLKAQLWFMICILIGWDILWLKIKPLILIHGGCSVLLGAEAEQTDLLNRACFGRPIITAEKDKQWFQLGMEEAYYLCYSLKCLKIIGEDNCPKNDEELWQYMNSKRETFPDFYKAYSHLRMKNWVVRSGSQYGVDFVAYRHHPTLVHSEFAVLVLAEGDGDANGRLRVWSDFQCTIRLCGSVAKTLLVLNINKNGHSAVSPLCLERHTVEERTITRWSPEQCREDQAIVENGSK